MANGEFTAALTEAAIAAAKRAEEAVGGGNPGGALNIAEAAKALTEACVAAGHQDF